MNNWQDKTVLITGAGSGIGFGILKKALAEGARVAALVRRSSETLEQLAANNLLVHRGDVARRADVKHLVELCKTQFGPIDILINNAGAMFYMDIKNPDYEQMQQMINTNCSGFINLVQEALPSLRRNPAGHWLNITSDAGKQPFAGLAVYSGSKAFVEFSARAMRQELMAENIKVTNIQPGNVATPLHKKSTDKQALEQFASENTGQYLQVADIVQAVDYAVNTPANVAVNEVLVQPLAEPT